MAVTYDIEISPLPSDFRGTPQEFFEAIVKRMVITSDAATFVISDTMPTSNQGPWLKNGTQWWVWDEDTSTYIPQDLSASINQQVFVGEDEPDPDEYQIWLKIDGIKFIGWFTWMGDVAGWVEEDSELSAGSVTSAFIADGAITTDKIANLAVTAAKLANDIPVTKLAPGTANQFLRTKSDGSTTEWGTFPLESTEISLVVNTTLTAAHNLGQTPRFVRGVFVNKVAEHGWEPGDEVDYTAVWDANDYFAALFANDENVGVVLPDNGTPEIRKNAHTGSARGTMTLASWKFKFYYAAS